MAGCPVVSEPVGAYFTRFLRVLPFCLEVPNGVVFGVNGVVKGVVEIVHKLYLRFGLEL